MTKAFCSQYVGKRRGVDRLCRVIQEEASEDALLSPLPDTILPSQFFESGLKDLVE